MKSTSNGTFTDGTSGMFDQLEEELRGRGASFKAKTTYYDASRRQQTDEEREAKKAEQIAKEVERLRAGLYDKERQKTLELPEFIVDNFLPLCAVGTLAGEPSAGKSTFLVHLCRCLNHGSPLAWEKVEWEGRENGVMVPYVEPNLAGSVIYVSPEDPNSIIARLSAWDSKHDPARELEASSPHQTYVLKACPNLDDEISYQALLHLVDETKPILVIFDTLASTLSERGSESATPEHDNTLLTRLYQSATRLCTERRLSSIVAHHPAKGGDLLRGGGAIRASSRFVYEIKPDGESRKIRIEKSNDFDRSLVSFSLKIEGQEVGTNKQGKPVTMPVMSWGKITPIATGQIKLALSCLNDEAEAGGVASRRDWCKRMIEQGIKGGSERQYVKRLTKKGLVEGIQPDKRGNFQAFKLTHAGLKELGLAEGDEQTEMKLEPKKKRNPKPAEPAEVGK
jgi:hypothetical protein